MVKRVIKLKTATIIALSIYDLLRLVSEICRTRLKL
jgi:hypothetical protein